MNKEEFNKFFKIHSQSVDDANTLGFWKLTDAIILRTLLDNMKSKSAVKLVDFGGGTGRWLEDLDPYFKDSDFTLVDLSDDMLGVARKRAKLGSYKNNRLTIVKSDISSVKSLLSNSVDYVISTYNPLSFVAKPQNVINEANRILKKGGTAMITVQGYYNALFSKVNNYIAPWDELKAIYQTKKVKWNEYVPALWQLSREDMEKMFAKSGFKNISSRGIACLAQPTAEDFDPENKQLSRLSKKLNEDKNYLNTLIEIEMEIGARPDVVNRGMNIMTIGSK